MPDQAFFVNFLLCVFFLSGAVHFIASNNDCGVRNYDMERFQLCKHFRFQWPVNVSSSCFVLHFFFFLYEYSLATIVLCVMVFLKKRE